MKTTKSLKIFNKNSNSFPTIFNEWEKLMQIQDREKKYRKV